MLARLRTPKGMALAVLAALLLGLASVLPQWLRLAQSVQVYLYGYPLVIMGVTRDVMSSPQALSQPAGQRKPGVGPVNQFTHIRKFPDHSFRDVVSPNADTLYSIAWLDLSAGPLVLHLPDMQGRWVLMEMLDAWTNAYASLGTRVYGGGPRDYLITGPDWKGTVPAGMTHVPSPTRMGWMLGRTYTRNEADFAAVHRFQDQYLLRPLDGAAPGAAASAQTPAIAVDVQTPPVRQLAAMDARAFYTRLLALMQDNPPAMADGPLLQKMERLGLHPGAPLAWDALRADQQAVLQTGLELSRALLDSAAPGTQGELRLSALQAQAMQLFAQLMRKAGMSTVNGWGLPLNLGVYDTNYPLRAVVALLGLGANVAADAVYPVTTVDADNAPLDGRNRYVLHFAAHEIPPAGAFWSLSMYNSESFFVDNPIRRYAIGDRDALSFQADGSLDLWIQADPPGDAQKSNWLPAPRGPFRLMLRIYDPKPEVLNRQWPPPAPRRLH